MEVIVMRELDSVEKDFVFGKGATCAGSNIGGVGDADMDPSVSYLYDPLVAAMSRLIERIASAFH